MKKLKSKPTSNSLYFVLRSASLNKVLTEKAIDKLTKKRQAICG